MGALALATTAFVAPASAQDVHTATVTRAPAGFYCGYVELTLYTLSAGIPTSQYRAADYNAAEVGQRYIIDPGINGAITGAWYTPAAYVDNLRLFRKLDVYPYAGNDHYFVLEVLAIPDVTPGQMTINVHLACRPEG